MVLLLNVNKHNIGQKYGIIKIVYTVSYTHYSCIYVIKKYSKYDIGKYN